MDGGKSDASTSTDDVKDRPLCLFYFTHPFGVLSPEPPTITTAPPSVTRAFLNMEPISPFYWPGSTAQTTPAEESSYRSTGPSTARYDIGDTTVHHEPLSVLSVARTRHACAVELPRRDSSTMSSSLFASDVWFPPSGSSRLGYARRAPYTRILPPLQLPSPKDVTDCSSDDIWPRKCLSKFSLPPIEMPPVTVTLVRDTRRGRGEELSSVDSVSSPKMGYALDNCPTLHLCCASVPLRSGVMLVSALGLVWAGAFIFLFSGAGKHLLTDLGMPKSLSTNMRYVHGIYGVLLCAVHLLLFIAAAYENDSLCEVYIWFMVSFWVVLVVSASWVAINSVLEDKFLFAGVFLSLIFFTILANFYFTIVVANFRMTLP
ncbi:Uncharacterized protein OBRU01_04540 [Operophtera brumata]|uniref:Uncharacterized protein n=1 Tax=Operophtera brumata TaxID=104452 RepID=A0A0L7LPR2_OPEBR|nr:Uncharacterized protein OBRU01_04540 [Operophtera brumata]